jgi:hypothetical protein
MISSDAKNDIATDPQLMALFGQDLNAAALCPRAFTKTVWMLAYRRGMAAGGMTGFARGYDDGYTQALREVGHMAVSRTWDPNAR